MSSKVLEQVDDSEIPVTEETMVVKPASAVKVIPFVPQVVVDGQIPAGYFQYQSVYPMPINFVPSHPMPINFVPSHPAQNLLSLDTFDKFILVCICIFLFGVFVGISILSGITLYNNLTL
uniref:Uncharacterized protein n=1 Tax=Panagrolaimus superbus TaxID=310955 RepID=A0A914YZ90_9BILA